MKRIAYALLCPCLLLTIACGPADRQEVTETRTVESPAVEARDTATQLGMPELSGDAPAPRTAPPAAPAAPSAPTAPGSAPMLDYDLPEGWEALPPRPMRDINLGVTGAEDTECFVSVIPGDGGGLAPNVNRWAAQVGLSPLSDDAIDALPRFEMLGSEGYLIELSGRYTGMRGEVDVPDALLLGAIAFLDTHGVFVKFTGPTAVVEQQREAFMAFCQSLRVGGTPTAVEAPAAAAAPSQPTGPFDPTRLSWTAPDNWELGADRPMREATFTVEDSPETECYITVLGSDGGGLGPNLSRWRAQMGDGTPYSEAEIDAMPRIPMLGGEAVLISIEGDYTGMTGPTFEGYALRGAVVLLGTHSVFVRMTGPAAVIEREHDNFIAFCQSLTTES